MKPYYQDDLVTIYHGDCLELLPELAFDVVVTDPPYGINWSQGQRHKNGPADAHAGIENDHSTECRDQMIAVTDGLPMLCFGSPKVAPPAGTRQVLVWQKSPGAGFFGCFAGWRKDWEAIYLLGDWKQAPPTRSSLLTTHRSVVNEGHPHAKPTSLLRELIGALPLGVILDPFMGSGSTLRAAKDLGRKAIGIEIDESYCEIAAKRMAQEVLDFR